MDYIKLFTEAIKAGRMTIDDVPEVYRAEVQALMEGDDESQT